ncbi:MAG: GGDEF domain-containing protein [Rhizobacter sp.]|nr:GGDEF domain-containing protein [Rhizobacter sp.]
MPHLFAPQSWNERPAMRAFVLAWAAAAAQTPIAAWAWVSCLALGLAASRWPSRSGKPVIDAPVAPPAREPALPAAPLAATFPSTPAQRRSDTRRTAATPAHRPPPSLLTAHLDAVTGLMTREHLHDTADAWLQSLRAGAQSVCVLQVALQGLGEIVDRYGHEAGNQLRVQVARRLRHVARADDRIVRLGDDSFMLLVSCPADEAAQLARSLAARIVSDVQRPLSYRTLSNLHIGCSVGSALWPLQGETLDEAMRQADAALQLACRSGRGQIRQYSVLREAVAA